MCSVIKTTTRRKEQRIPPPVRKLALPQLMFPKPFLLNMPPHAAIAADADKELLGGVRPGEACENSAGE